MKKLFITFIAVVIIFLCSLIYKNFVTPIFVNFPIKELAESPYNRNQTTFYLILFFSKKNCPPCVQQAISSLNYLPQNVKVFGVIKDEETQFIDYMKSQFDIKFPVKTIKNWKKFRPNYAPTLYGVDSKGRIFFVLPCVGLEESYFHSYLDEFLRKASNHLLYLNQFN